MTAFLVDANVFIEAKNRHYGLDFCPAFWDWMVGQNSVGRVASIAEVADELLAGEDALAQWVADHRTFFLPPDQSVLSARRTVSDWVRGEKFRDSAVTTFVGGADFALVAHALAHDCIVVTQEVRKDTARKIKIPNACIGTGVRWMNTYEMLRRERARFVLGTETDTA